MNTKLYRQLTVMSLCLFLMATAILPLFSPAHAQEEDRLYRRKTKRLHRISSCKEIQAWINYR